MLAPGADACSVSAVLGRVLPVCLTIACAPAPRSRDNPSPPPPAAALEPMGAHGLEDASASTRPASPAPPVFALLAEGFEARFTRRAYVAADLQRRSDVVLEEGDSRARLAIDRPDFRVAVWLGYAELREVAVRVAELRQKPSETSASTGAMVAPGAIIERREARGDHVDVVAVDGHLRAFGFMESAALGHVYAPGPLPPATNVPTSLPGSKASSRGWHLAPGATLRVRPGGFRSASFDRDAHPPRYVTQLGTVGWFHEVVYESAVLRVRGFVARQQLLALDPVGFGSAGFGVRAPEPRERLRFDAGSCLYDAPGGDVIGALKRSRTSWVHIEPASRGGWRNLQLAWPALSAWLPRGTPVGPDAGLPDDGKAITIDEDFRCTPPS